MRRLLPWALFLVAGLLVLPAAASAQSCPPFDGLMSFQDIQGPEDPEDYCWEVNLSEGEELRQIDETRAGVFWEDGTRAMLITAQLAHDAEGVSVPTTIIVAEPNLVTLTVHHREGNPAAGGAPFDYPVVAGVGWQGGFQSVQIQGPPDESVLEPKTPALPAEEAFTPTCEVPVLQGRTLKAARRALLRADCALGPVRGHRHPGARVVKQYRSAGKVLPAGAEVGVRLAR